MIKKSSPFHLFLWIGVSGALGACFRYAVSIAISETGFPYSTLIVNLSGCFLLTYFAKIISATGRYSNLLFYAVTTGFLGSLTTYSTFSLETINLFKKDFFLAFAYMLISLTGGLLCCWLGYKTADRKLVAR